MDNFYIYSEDYICYEVFTINSEREKVFNEILNFEIQDYDKYYIYKENFDVIRENALIKLNRCLEKHPTPFSELTKYGEAFTGERFHVEKKILRKKLRLFKGGNDLIILFLSNIIEIIDYVRGNSNVIIVSRFKKHSDFFDKKTHTE